ncbi:MAG: HAD family hydrolase [Paludibacteraceae bacterium]
MTEQAVNSYLKRNNFHEISPKAIFFDMDGVLFDSMPNHSVAWVKTMNEFGLPFTQLEAYMCEGQPGADTVNNAYRKIHGHEATEEERQAIYKVKGKYFDELGEPKRMDYSYELLKKLKEQGYKLYVVTGSGHPTLLGSLKTYFPGIFEKENVISAFDVKQGKPHPEPYLKALAKAGVEPWEALVVENAPLGVMASSAARIFTFGVNTGPLDKNVLSKNGADLVLDSMRELYEKWDNFDF